MRMIFIVVNLTYVIIHFSDLVSEYQQYQEATVDDDDDEEYELEGDEDD